MLICNCALLYVQLHTVVIHVYSIICPILLVQLIKYLSSEYLPIRSDIASIKVMNTVCKIIHLLPKAIMT